MGGYGAFVKVLDDEDDVDGIVVAEAQVEIGDAAGGLEALQDEEEDDEDARALRALEAKRKEAEASKESRPVAAAAVPAAAPSVQAVAPTAGAAGQKKKRGREDEPPVVEEPWVIKRRRANPGATLLDTGRIKPVLTATQLVNFRVMNFLSPYILFGSGPELTHRHGACAGVVLGPGQVLLAGGNNGLHCHRTTTVLTWAEGRGVAAQAGPVMGVPRKECAAVKLDDSRILIVGGHDGQRFLDSTEIFYIRTGECRPGPSLISPRAGMAVTKLESGHVLVLGGRNSAGVLKSTEMWDSLHGNSFHRGPSMLLSRVGPSVVVLDERRILVLGGADEATTHNLAELLTVGIPVEAARMSFALGRDIGVPRAFFSVAMLNTGSVLLIGGHDGVDFLDSTEVLNINNMEVSGGPRLKERRARCAAALVAENRILVAGGSNDAMDLASTELLTQKEYAISPTPWIDED
mmetsp:Transcript_8274/g.18492  ORF Transcript_8274/g.18492 Transcript_8274/m.18492 type:complete len:463 (-) Transcript_8274:158-1546(-)